MILEINGKEVCESKAIYGNGGEDYETIHNMSGCPSDIPLKKGDELVLKSVYDLASHPLYVPIPVRFELLLTCFKDVKVVNTIA
jgi:hypothetical protein